MEFTVAEAEAYTEDQIAILGMGENDEEGHSVVLQCNLGELDESERQMGWDTYHIAIDDERSTYGGVTSCAMSDEAVTIYFNGTTAEKIGTPELVLALNLTEEQRSTVATYLRIIFTSGRESEHPQLDIARP